MIEISLLKFAYRPLMRRSARQILEGRLLDPERPERGRWLHADVRAYLAGLWRRVEMLLPAAKLETLPTYGGRHNVFLAVVTTAAYRELLERGVSRDYAVTLAGDVGWKVYARMLQTAALLARLTTRDPHKRMEKTLRWLMTFPFGGTGAPDYESRAWSEGGRIYTHWTHCPPQAFARQLTESGTDEEALEGFRRTWCQYDWAAADLLADDGTNGHYSRPHTMSAGDGICDMCWWAQPQGHAQGGRAQEARGS